MPLEVLYTEDTEIEELRPLEDLSLNPVGTPVRDLNPLRKDALAQRHADDRRASPLSNVPLVSLTLKGSCMRGLQTLHRLHVADTPIANLTPLRGTANFSAWPFLLIRSRRAWTP